MQLNRLLAVAIDRGIAVIEDATQAISTELNARKAGNFGDFGVFSFHGLQTLAAEERETRVTDGEKTRDRVLFVRNHRRLPAGKMFWNSEIGSKYKMRSRQLSDWVG
jgi:perosamine synthetase